MTYYAFIENDKINGCGQCECLNIQNIEITEEQFNNIQDYIYSNGEIVINPELDSIKLQKAKDLKIEENDRKRDEALLQGVLYNSVLFDSDTDQKVNLLAMIETMDDEQIIAPVQSGIATSPESSTSEPTLNGSSPAAVSTIVWFGKDNQPLTCTKEDLFNIGGLITQLHSFCWNKNAQIKQAINSAATIEEVEAIDIDYTESEGENGI